MEASYNRNFFKMHTYMKEILRDPPNNRKGKAPTKHFQPQMKPPVAKIVSSNQVVDQRSPWKAPNSLGGFQDSQMLS